MVFHNYHDHVCYKRAVADCALDILILHCDTCYINQSQHYCMYLLKRKNLRQKPPD